MPFPAWGTLAVSALALLLLLPACTADTPRLTLAVGGAPSEVAFWRQLVADFTDSTGIAVEFRRQPTDSSQRQQGLVVALEARQTDPDVFLMDVVWIAQFAASGWLRPLTIDPEPFFARVVHLVDRYEGALIALPIYVDGGLLYYRKDLLQRCGIAGPPRTWQELIDQAHRVLRERETSTDESGPAPREAERFRPATADEFYGFVWQGAQYEGLVCTFLEFAASGGGRIFAGGRPVLATPQNERALTLMHDLIHKYGISPPSTFTQMKEEEVRETFQRGGALFERNWPYAWALHQAAGSPVAGKVGIAPLPSFRGGEPAATLGGYHVGISSYTDVPRQAERLVHYLTSYEVQKRLALVLGWNPGRTGVYADPEVLQRMPHLATLRTVFDRAVARPVLPYYTQVSEVLQRRLNAALAGQSTPTAALAAAQAELEKLAERYGAPSDAP
jgi:multiple sugar transport system substrate-binding protein